MNRIYVLLLFIPMLFACGPQNDGLTMHNSQAIHDHDRCHMCGMMITKYPGPKGEVLLKNSDVIPKFCSTRDMFNFILQPENQRQVSQVYVHDMAKTSWEMPKDDSFIDGVKAWYVYGSNRKGVMGPSVGSFSSADAAQNFANEFGGAVLAYDEITLEVLGEGMSHEKGMSHKKT
ncbi:nitrous oxide reductase accessory protein NosL [Shewanella psychromarinicola]|jgi:copper chaperone NosL|uniref:Nitrous oxide reductase accessory protein NosL n=1 Tax=Shewanella psychromarinicola TaxID=2487742 RepID=A0A3N4E8X0_9GAMM|nr:nitrous oxide reductase accessory protein NosL [Shewanella psychromarinicola]AZG34842.1 nitrous oxide reductase accessory protein NosL [Shewanella psychromarinicola]MCL1082936.1 nitrous oxide reductase accessory protein NosL [Shewanella psychromarinicola]RPA33366.1 nitrous oxide reductase accessory protein NosL [Shewanella psychromarinicola]